MDSSGLVTFNVVDDQILSGNVTITLTIVEVSPPIVAIDPVDYVASVVILDNDSECIFVNRSIGIVTATCHAHIIVWLTLRPYNLL